MLLKLVLHGVENIVGIGENAGYKHFLLFQHCFQKGVRSCHSVVKVNCLGNNKFLDWSNLKGFVGNKLNVTEKLKFVFDSIGKHKVIAIQGFFWMVASIRNGTLIMRKTVCRCFQFSQVYNLMCGKKQKLLTLLYCGDYALQDNWSALLYAAKDGHLEITIELLERQAELEHRDMVCINRRERGEERGRREGAREREKKRGERGGSRERGKREKLEREQSKRREQEREGERDESERGRERGESKRGERVGDLEKRRGMDRGRERGEQGEKDRERGTEKQVSEWEN